MCNISLFSYIILLWVRYDCEEDCRLSQMLMAQPFYTDFVCDSYVSFLNDSLKEPAYVNHWFVI